MGFDEIVGLLVNNGVGVTCIVYFMFRDYHFMQKLTDALASLNATLSEIQILTREIESRKENDNDL